MAEPCYRYALDQMPATGACWREQGWVSAAVRTPGGFGMCLAQYFSVKKATAEAACPPLLESSGRQREEGGESRGASRFTPEREGHA